MLQSGHSNTSTNPHQENISQIEEHLSKTIPSHLKTLFKGLTSPYVDQEVPPPTDIRGIFQTIDELFRQALINLLLKKKLDQERKAALEFQPLVTKKVASNSFSIEEWTAQRNQTIDFRLIPLLEQYLKTGASFKRLMRNVIDELNLIFKEHLNINDTRCFIIALHSEAVQNIRASIQYMIEQFTESKICDSTENLATLELRLEGATLPEEQENPKSKTAFRSQYQEHCNVNFLLGEALESILTALEVVSKEKDMVTFGFSSNQTTRNMLDPEHLNLLELLKHQQVPFVSVFIELNTLESVNKNILREFKEQSISKAREEKSRSYQNSPHHSIEIYQAPAEREILYARTPGHRLRLMCIGERSENITALLKHNPVFDALFTGGALRYSGYQFSLLFPAAKPYVQVFLIPEITGAILGFIIGHEAVVNPGSKPPQWHKIVEALSKGGIVFIGTMNISINLYLLLNNNSTSDSVLEVILPGPCVATLLFTTWELIPFEVKELWAAKSQKARYAVNSGLFLSKWLVYTGALTFLELAVLNVPGKWWSLVLPPITASVAAILALNSSFEEKVALTMRIITAINFCFLIGKDVYQQQPPLGITITRAVAWGLTALGGTADIIMHRLEFIKDYVGPPRIIAGPRSYNDLSSTTEANETTRLVRDPLMTSSLENGLARFDDLPQEQKDDIVGRTQVSRTLLFSKTNNPTIQDTSQTLSQRPARSCSGRCHIL